MTSRMVGSVLTLVTLLFSVVGGAAQTYTQIQWGMNKGVTPYAFGANINGTWRDLGTVSASGAWGLTLSSILVQPTATTPSNIYSAIFPGVTFSDTIQAVRDITAGTTQENNAGIAAFVKNASGGAPSSGGNGVGFFAAIQSVANNSPVWGLNTLCQDAPTRAVSALTGNYCIGAELDFNIMSPSTQVIGVSVGGNSLTQPTTSNAYLVNTLSQALGYKWGAGFVSLAGVTDIGVSLGAKSASGSNIESQNIQLEWRDGAAASQIMVMKMAGGFLSFQNTGAWNGISINGALTVSSFATFQNFSTFNVAPRIKGSSTGTTIIETANSSATDYTATLPANTGTIVETNLAQAFTATQTFSSGIISAGTAPTATGSGGTCAAGAVTGGALAGTVALTGVCAATDTLALTSMPAATTGYVCDAADRTTGVVNLVQTATTTTGATFTFNASTGATDVVQFKCLGY